MQFRTLRAAVTLGALVFAAASPAASSAQITAQLGAAAFGDNILLMPNQSGSTLVGSLNGDPTITFTIMSTTDILQSQASGQATITALDGLINNITVCSMLPNVFTDFVANAQDGNGTGVITGLTGTGASFGPFDPFSDANRPLGNGQNFFQVNATGGETLQCVTLDTSEGFSFFKQVRVNPAVMGSGNPGSQEVPEPGTLALLGGSVLAGCMVLARRRKA
jgi:hypothetical protein